MSREHDIAVVISERDALSKCAQNLLDLIGEVDTFSDVDEGPGKVKADKVVVEMSQHLGNIGGFCDNWTRNKILVMQKIFALSLTIPLGYNELKTALPFIVGIQVDFTKRPFRAVGLNIDVFSGKFKALLKK